MSLLGLAGNGGNAAPPPQDAQPSATGVVEVDQMPPGAHPVVVTQPTYVAQLARAFLGG